MDSDLLSSLNTSPTTQTPLIRRAEGVTEAERYLQKLCNRSFLSLWSYSGIYRDQNGKISGKAGDGKEVCDLLVVFQNHILIFSDKDCRFPESGNLELDWSRWFRRAVLDSAKQVYGAERWIKEHPDRLFTDRACTQRFPVELPPLDKAIFHRIVVAHDGARRCREELGGSGSLMIAPHIVGDQHSAPFSKGGRAFTFGQVDPARGYVHVFDDTSLDIVMQTLDTVSDFVAYLQKKEAFVLSGRLGMAAGEEELLAHYLKRLNPNDEHDFVVPSILDKIYLAEGDWEEFTTNPQRLAQIEANKVSYFWDSLIEEFCRHIYAGTSYMISHPNLRDQEKLFRLAARETRTRRRMLSTALFELMEKTPLDQRGLRVFRPSGPGDPYYAFLLLPHLKTIPEAQYREVRGHFLEAVCRVVKVKFPDAQDVMGIATETGINSYSSHDAVYFDARQWTPEDEAETRKLQQDLGILVNVEQFARRESEYPSLKATAYKKSVAPTPNRYPANYACPCGSGRKYKRCCGQANTSN